MGSVDALTGRRAECGLMDDLVTGASASPVVLVRGEPGIGKTSLVAWARDVAASRGMVTLSAAGTPTERGLPFATLHQLLHPLGTDEKTPRWRRAVADALNALDAPEAAGAAMVGTAMSVLELLTDVARETGLFVAVDDVQWVDGPTRDVLTFVARRLGPEPVRLALAGRDEQPDPLEEVALGQGWHTVRLSRLDDVAAAALLDRVAPDLPADARRRVLDEAAGNPLAIKELPKTITDAAYIDGGDLLPVSRRLESAFASRMAVLPERTRRLVLLAALHDSDAVGEVLAAGRVLTGMAVSLRDFEPAVEVGLVEIDRDKVRFGHPLVRSAVSQDAGPATRQEAHRVLARTARSPDRRVWHAAAAAEAPDEAVADQLDQAAVAALQGGALETAARAYEEAARLSADPRRRATRQLLLLEMLDEMGQRDRALTVLELLDPAVLDAGERTRLNWMHELLTTGAWSGGDRVRLFAQIARRMHADGDTRRATAMLVGIALRSWWSNVDADTSRLLAESADEVTAADSAVHLIVTSLAAPEERGAKSLAAYDRLDLSLADRNAEVMLGLGLGAAGLGDHPRGRQLYALAVADGRRQGRLSSLTQALAGSAWCELHLGRLRRAEVAGEEGRRLALETMQPLWEATSSLAVAASRSLRGDVETALMDADRAEEVFLAVGADPMLALVRTVRGYAALARGQYDEAFTQLYAVFDPHDVAFHQHHCTFLVAELAEAGALGTRAEAAREAIDAVLDRRLRTGSPVLAAGALVARPLLAEESAKADLFEEALRDGLAAWPMHRARVQLHYGAWLRRGRRIAEARGPLRLAHETFAGLGAVPWAERAAVELRAAGDLPPEQVTAAWEHLTAQEIQIAALAAAGLTNRQIGERLFLSHRTVSSHLYHIFPKLGISSRGQLGAALAGLETSEDLGRSGTAN
ncbi:helix-turn-helix transcriptional regulator [Nocardioides conyzicola]